MRGMHRSRFYSRGFTIVELLIVVVVIAILASITIVAYNGIQQKARNTARVQTADAMRKNMLLYQAEFGHNSLYGMLLPGSGEGQCLGTDYQDVDPGASISCRYVTPDTGAPYSTPINQALYDALRGSSKYSMNYTPVSQKNFSGLADITSSAPFIAQSRFSETGSRSTIDNGPLRDYYVLLSYRLEGVNQSCQLPVVRISSQTSTQVNFTSGHPYSVTNGGATECWLWLDW